MTNIHSFRTGPLGQAAQKQPSPLNEIPTDIHPHEGGIRARVPSDHSILGGGRKSGLGLPHAEPRTQSEQARVGLERLKDYPGVQQEYQQKLEALETKKKENPEQAAEIDKEIGMLRMEINHLPEKIKGMNENAELFDAYGNDAVQFLKPEKLAKELGDQLKHLQQAYKEAVASGDMVQIEGALDALKTKCQEIQDLHFEQTGDYHKGLSYALHH